MNRSKRRAFERQAALHPDLITGLDRHRRPPGMDALVGARQHAGWRYDPMMDWWEPPLTMARLNAAASRPGARAVWEAPGPIR